MTNKQIKPTHVYELRLPIEDGYLQLLVSLDKSLLEQFIERVRAHDHKYLQESRDNDDFDLDDFDEHPLSKWTDEIFGWSACEYDFYWDLEDMDGESWASSLEIVKIELCKGDDND